MTSTLTILKRTLKWLAILLLTLLVLLIGSWLLIPDEKIDADTARVLGQRTTVPVADNAYFAMWGFGADPARDAHAAGQAIVADVAARRERKESLANFDQKALLGPASLKLANRKRTCAVDTTPNCLAAYLADGSLEGVAQGYAPYLARYRALRGYTQYGDAMPASFDSPIPQYQGLIEMSELVDAGIARQMQSPATRQAALTELSAELAMWNRVARNTDLLITRMISTAVLQRKYRLASELIAAYPSIALDHRDLVAAIASPLPMADVDLRRPLEGEVRFVASGMLDEMYVASSSDGNGVPLLGAMRALGGYKPNATVNMHRVQMTNAAAFYARPAAEALKEERRFIEQSESVNVYSPAFIGYNPVGKILMGIATPFYGEYAWRLHDLQAFTRVVEIQRRIALEKITPENVPAFLQSLPAELQDPYTGKPMVWNAKTGKISFEARARQFKLAKSPGVSVFKPS